MNTRKNQKKNKWAQKYQNTNTIIIDAEEMDPVNEQKSAINWYAVGGCLAAIAVVLFFAL